MTTEQMEWLKSAIDVVGGNFADKVEKHNIIVYRVKNIIRIDIKEV